MLAALGFVLLVLLGLWLCRGYLLAQQPGDGAKAAQEDSGAEDPGPPGDEAGGLRRRKKGKDSAWVKVTPPTSGERRAPAEGGASPGAAAEVGEKIGTFLSGLVKGAAGSNEAAPGPPAEEVAEQADAPSGAVEPAGAAPTPNAPPEMASGQEADGKDAGPPEETEKANSSPSPAPL